MNLFIYIHGKGGDVSEAEHYKLMFPDDVVIGFDYQSLTPWEAEKEFSEYFDEITANYNKVYLIANSIGAYYSLCSLGRKKIEKAYFISPVVDMEKLICDMMKWANVTENELHEKGEITTDFSETLSWNYLEWVRNHKIEWNIPTEILYGRKDNLQSSETIHEFCDKHNADVTVMEDGEHWFHTEKQMVFLDKWIKEHY